MTRLLFQDKASLDAYHFLLQHGLSEEEIDQGVSGEGHYESSATIRVGVQDGEINHAELARALESYSRQYENISSAGSTFNSWYRNWTGNNLSWIPSTNRNNQALIQKFDRDLELWRARYFQCHPGESRRSNTNFLIEELRFIHRWVCNSQGLEMTYQIREINLDEVYAGFSSRQVRGDCTDFAKVFRHLIDQTGDFTEVSVPRFARVTRLEDGSNGEYHHAILLNINGISIYLDQGGVALNSRARVIPLSDVQFEAHYLLEEARASHHSIPSMQRAYSLAPLDPDILNIQALYLLVENTQEAARLVNKNPSNPDYRLSFIYHLCEDEQVEAAVEQLHLLENTFPHYHQLHFAYRIIANACVVINQFERAMFYSRRSLELNSENLILTSATHLRIIYCLVSLGKRQEAQNELLLLNRLQPPSTADRFTRGSYLNNLSCAFDYLGNHPKTALHLMKQAHSIDPNNPMHLYSLITLLIEQRDIPRARVMLQRLVAIYEYLNEREFAQSIGRDFIRQIREAERAR